MTHAATLWPPACPAPALQLRSTLNSVLLHSGVGKQRRHTGTSLPSAPFKIKGLKLDTKRLIDKEDAR